MARLEWRELLVTQRAGGASPAAKLRAGMQQLLFAHGSFLLPPFMFAPSFRCVSEAASEHLSVLSAGLV